MNDIKIGDHVGVIDTSEDVSLKGLRGVVKGFNYTFSRDPLCAVEFSVNVKGGHSCDGKTKEGYGRWIFSSDLTVVEDHSLRRCGARVRVIGNGHPIWHHAPIGSTGEITNYGPCESLIVKFDEPIHDGVRMKETQFVSPQDLALVKDTVDESENTGWKVVITPDGDDTIAVLYNNEKMERYARVRRFHKDTYDKSVAAIEAAKKLFGKQEKPEPEKPKGFTGKAMYKGDGRALDGFTIGRIYTFSNGLTRDDKQNLRPLSRIKGPYTTDPWINEFFIKVVE